MTLLMNGMNYNGICRPLPPRAGHPRAGHRLRAGRKNHQLSIGVDAYNTNKYERIAMIMATSQAGTTVFRWNPMPNWRKLPSSLYMNRGLNA